VLLVAGKADEDAHIRPSSRFQISEQAARRQRRDLVPGKAIELLRRDMRWPQRQANMHRGA
jgi:hypothetical protein